MSKHKNLSPGEALGIDQKIIAPFFALLALSTSLAFPMEKSGTGFKDTRNSINSGGTRKTGSTFQLDSAIGETAPSSASAGGFMLRSGLMTYYFYPGTITNLVASSDTYAGSVKLTWTADGADGSTSTATSYVIKWDTKTIGSQAAFEGATTYAQTITPAAPNSAEAFTLSNLDRDTTMYVRIVARDSDKNQSYLSNAVSTATAAAAISLSITQTDLDFGSLALTSSVVHGTTVRVTHNGNVRQDYLLKAATATTDTPWSLGSPVDINVVELRSAFHATQPSSTSFAANDVLTYANQTPTSAVFSIDGSTTGTNVGINEIRDLWLNLRTPLQSSTTFQQQLTLTITAQETP